MPLTISFVCRRRAAKVEDEGRSGKSDLALAFTVGCLREDVTVGRGEIERGGGRALANSLRFTREEFELDVVPPCELDTHAVLCGVFCLEGTEDRAGKLWLALIEGPNPGTTLPFAACWTRAHISGLC